MILAVLAAVAFQTPAFAQTPALAETPGVEAARRVAATLQLAAQEYRLAWVRGALANPGEWDEAKAFVAEAHRSSAQLPANVRAGTEPRPAALDAHVLTFTDPAARRGRTGQLAVVFGTTRGSLGSAMELASRGDFAAAGSRVLDAYMAFEAVEASLNATDPGVVKRAEERFSNLRAAMADHAPAGLASAHAALLASLRESEQALAVRHSAAGLFAESLLLVLREGFEAVLV